MKARILDKIGDWFVRLFDWWTPSPEQHWQQMQELSEATAELRQALIETFEIDRLADWLAKWLDWLLVRARGE